MYSGKPPPHVRLAAATVAPAPPADSSVVEGLIVRRHGAYLPHWETDGATYAITFRLADALPRQVIAAYRAEREMIVRHAFATGRSLTWAERRRLRELHDARVDRALDAGLGECLLRDARCALVVRDALACFDGTRYDIGAWCVMPSHVHVVVRPIAKCRLGDMLHSWKSFAASRINRMLGRTGVVWQREYYDHLIRDEGELQHAIGYVIENPAAAGLDAWPWVGRRMDDADAFGRATRR